MNGEEHTMSCSHADALVPVPPRTPDGCEECLKSGGRWVHLRRCLTCQQVACCDSSPAKHATAHFQASGHPVITSAEPGESWRWCYVDRVGG